MRNRTPRTAFTLVELLVAAALSMVIMGIIAVAFQKGVDTFRVLRSVGQMQEKLKSADMVLKRDLSAEHFDGNFRVGYNGPFVHDQRMDLSGWTPPDQGYFEIQQGAASTQEGVDSDGIPSYMATNHKLRFTTKLSGKRNEDWFYSVNGTSATPGADVNFSTGTLAASRWAEIYYFLAPPPGNPSANGTPLYTLYRQERVLLGTNGAAANGFQTPASVAKAATRNGGAGFTTTPAPNPTIIPGATQGDDILLTDVISFEVKANWTVGTPPAGSAAFATPFRTIANNPDWPFDDLQNTFSHFDTGSMLDAGAMGVTDWNDPTKFLIIGAGVPPMRVRMNALQIRIRIWDANAQQARQITIVQHI